MRNLKLRIDRHIAVAVAAIMLSAAAAWQLTTLSTAESPETATSKTSMSQSQPIKTAYSGAVAQGDDELFVIPTLQLPEMPVSDDTETVSVAVVSSKALLEAIDRRETFTLFDLREKSRYEISHLPGAVWLAVDGEEFLRVLPKNKTERIVLYAAGGDKPAKSLGIILQRLHDLGYTQVAFFQDGWHGWLANGLPTYATDTAVLKKNTLIIDLRNVDDAAISKIPGAVNIPLSLLSEAVDKLPKNHLIVLYSQTEDDAILAYQFLHRHKLYNVVLLSGGLLRWVKDGKPLEVLKEENVDN